MAMEITKHENRALFMALEYEFFELVNLWRQLFISVVPDSIQVDAGEIRAIITMDDSVRV